VSAPADRFWAALPLGRDVVLLNRDPNGLAAFAKPAGVLSHPNKAGEEPRSLLNAGYTLEGESYRWVDESGAARQLWLLNRLDSATSGVILAAGSAELAASLRDYFKRKAVRKIYQALVFGSPRQTAELWRDRLAVEKQGGRIRTAAHAGHIPAESQMTVVRTRRGDQPLALLRLEPRTGRSHQLRVQCAKRQLPIVGDQTYGNFARNREFAKANGTKRLFLHSLETSFDYAWAGRKFSFVARAPLPPEFTGSF
jgi:23S rRNA-/tRNA-specific pseudouridylate synthase